MELMHAVDEYILPITKELLNNLPASNEIWNVNFPGCSLDEVKGIVWDAKSAPQSYCGDNLMPHDNGDGTYTLDIGLHVADAAPEGTDIYCLLNNYISVGKIKNSIIK